MAGPDEDERVGGQTADSLIDRGATDTDRVLQFLHRQQQPGLQGAGDDQLLEPVVSELSQVHAIGARGLLPAPPGRSQSGLPACAFLPLGHRFLHFPYTPIQGRTI